MESFNIQVYSIDLVVGTYYKLKIKNGPEVIKKFIGSNRFNGFDSFEAGFGAVHSINPSIVVYFKQSDEMNIEIDT